MDPCVAKLKNLKECEVFAKNARERGAPQLADEARQRAIQLRAERHGPTTDVERECLEAVYAMEEMLSAERGMRTRATKAWLLMNRSGIIAVVEFFVMRRKESVGFTVLAEMGLKDFALEAVVLRHPEHFTAAAVTRSREHLGKI